MFDIIENTTRAGGHATIIVRKPIPDGVSITGVRITRSGTEKNVLGPRGWQAKPALLQPGSIDIDDLGATLEIGPDIVDAIAPDTLLTLVVSGPDFTEQLFWPHITPSPYSNPDRFNASKPRLAPATGTKDKDEDLGEEPTIGTPPIDGSPPRRHYWVIALVLFILVICGGLTWWYFFQQEETVPPLPVAPYAERYRLLLETDDTGSDLLALYREISESDNFDDNVAFQALQAAAVRKNNAEAQMSIAALYDPLTYDDRFFSAPNPTLAAVEYDKASALGSAAAGGAKQAMCAAAETQSAALAEAFASFDKTVSCP